MLKYFKSLIIFSLPIMAGQVGLMLIGMGDVWVATHHSSQAVASIGIANGLISPLMLLGIGMNMGLSPKLSQLSGEGQNIDKYLKSSLIFSFIYSLPATFGVALIALIVPSLGFDQELNEPIIHYLIISSPSMIFVTLYGGIREYLQAEGKLLLANSVSIIAVIFNIICNQILVFGTSYTPSLGIDGLAWASLATRFFMFFCLLLSILPRKFWIQSFDKIFFKETTRFCYPIAFSFFFEVLAFSMLAPIIGMMSTLHAAAHNIVINVASTSFMIPLSISSALATKVGHAYGERNYLNIKSYILSGLCLTQFFAILCGSIYMFFPEVLLYFFPVEQSVYEIAIHLFFIVAIFQFFDNAQVGLGGILRGLGISKPILLSNLFGFWIVGIPLGIYLAKSKGMLSIGLWWSIALGLMIVATLLGLTLISKLKRIKHNFAT